jgi:hypothetical protein
MTCTAFQITSDDVENVLRNNSLRVTKSNGKTFAHMAEALIDLLDHEQIEQAALDASTNLAEQTSAAYEQIKDNLEELGVLAS